MSRNIAIFGMLLRPCSLNLEDNEETMKSSDYFTDKNFLEKYNHNLGINTIISELAKIYILENWSKVKDWSELSVKILDNSSDLFSFQTAYQIKDPNEFKLLDIERQVAGAFIDSDDYILDLNISGLVNVFAKDKDTFDKIKKVLRGSGKEVS